MGAHVSQSPHQQTLRQTPLATRFNTACFGVLGYELDLKHLTRVEKKEIADQIAFYKKHRRLFQYGRFNRGPSSKKNQLFWQCTDSGSNGRSERGGGGGSGSGGSSSGGDGSGNGSNGSGSAVTGFFQGTAEAADGHSILRIQGLDTQKQYRVQTKPQRLFIKRFGGLVKHILPVDLDPDGFILRMVNRYYALWDCTESYTGDGKLLGQGILLNNQFMGSYYNDKTELLGDFGSYIFTVEELSC
jgi:alpha-galactosidase